MNNFQKYLVDEFVEDYSEGRLSRREALKMIAAITGNLLLASTLLAACAPPPQTTVAPAATEAAPAAPTEGPTQAPAIATAEPTVQPAVTEAASATPPAQPATISHGTVVPDDPAIVAGPIEFEGEGATLLGYLARPNAEGTFPVVLICHENRGLTGHIQDIARRFAKAGYVGLAVDLLSRQGGTDTVGSSNVPGALGNIAPEQFVQDFLSGWHYLQGQAFAQAERVGMTGFCFGGGVTWLMATQMPELKAAVPFYGPHPAVDAVPGIQAAVLAMYGELDGRINQGIPAIEAAMQQNNKIYEKMIYSNADHAFNNDTGTRYNPEAAQDAWARVLAWFAKYV